ncbi:tRNA(Ile)-lysidine synthase [Bacilli bacterium PM5-3]|nr:tRNA(Ile)-lysidine synthase [Bacilli bacterium PM5-3]MDH6603995.1 tRNA(Ile)-lysidine synthase [Bacilli bacterium PM5-9]
MIVVAVSAGIDSMVLLDYLYKQNQEIVIAHVNYQKRVDSFIDSITIKEFIKDKNIKFEELIVDKESYTSDNFQAQARYIRYDFFKEIAKKYNTNDVYVAHHKDDYLETYLFKVNRKGLYDYYGIKETSEYNGMIIHRPLINLYKEDIEKYAKENGIPFHEDSSNKTLDYTRNQIRQYLSSLSVVEKNNIYKEAVLKNEENKNEINFVKENNVKFLKVEVFNSWSKDIKRRWLFNAIKKYDITTKYLDDICYKISYSNNFKVTFLDTTIAKAYDIIYVLDNSLNEYSKAINNENDFNKMYDEWKNNYNYIIRKPKCDYPYIIRNYRKEDFDFLSLDYKKFRLKIKKKKTPFFLREYLPVVEKDGKIIEFIY